MTKKERIEDILEILDLADEVEQRRRIAILMNAPPWRHNFVAGFFPEDSQKCDKCGKKLRIKEDYDEGCPYTHSYSGSLADLAFKLRNEVKEDTALFKETSFHRALLMVSECLRCKEESRKFDSEIEITFREVYWVWWAICAQPIHWIVASLIAKTLSKKEEEGN